MARRWDKDNGISVIEVRAESNKLRPKVLAAVTIVPCDRQQIVLWTIIGFGVASPLH